MDGFIIVLPEGVLSSEQRAERISRELRTLLRDRTTCHTRTLSTRWEGVRHGGASRRGAVRFTSGYRVQHTRESIGYVRTAYIAYDGTHRNRST